MLSTGLEVARDSAGAFDPTLGALVDRWGFGAAPWSGEPPSAHEVRTLGDAAGWDKVVLDPAAQRGLQPGGVRLDLSGIAKGYAVDRLAALLRGAGLRSSLAEIGGELVGEGIKPDGQPWWVDLEVPPGASLPPIRVALHGLAVATSGDYRRFFERDGTRLAHTLDPRTGAPLDNRVASTTVLHASCMMADALATAITVLGPMEGLRFADASGIACHMVVRDGAGFGEHVSAALAAMLA